jgi:hypothetical protein
MMFCTRTGLMPNQIIGAAVIPWTSIASETRRRPRLGIEDVCVEDAGWRGGERMRDPVQPPHVEVGVLMRHRTVADMPHLLPHHDAGEEGKGD